MTGFKCPRTSEPHFWRSPKNSDDALHCDDCGYRIPFESIDLSLQGKIVSEIASHGTPNGKMLTQESIDTAVMFDFDLTMAMDHWRCRSGRPIRDNKSKSV